MQSVLRHAFAHADSHINIITYQSWLINRAQVNPAHPCSFQTETKTEIWKAANSKSLLFKNSYTSSASSRHMGFDKNKLVLQEMWRFVPDLYMLMLRGAHPEERSFFLLSWISP